MTQGGRLPLIMPISVESGTRRGYEEVQYCSNNPVRVHLTKLLIALTGSQAQR
jgi:hypothetical protein